jgi:RimJ/RimL family protein N-acetyltransferase
VKVRRFSNARAFLDRAEAWLICGEAEHNLLLGIAHQMLRENHPYEDPIYLATVEEAGEVVGCAWRTPPLKLGLTRLPMASLPLLVRDVAAIYTSLPSVLGPEAEASQFAERWTRQIGGHWNIGMRQRIHVLDRVVAPTDAARGTLRRAELSEVALAAEWGAGFSRDVGIADADPRAYAERVIRSGSLYVWEDDRPRSMAVAIGATPNGIRIGYVYTPPSFRGRGYATAAVASLSQRMLDSGHRFCFLYTDTANPTSNALYARIGYRPVCDVVNADIAGERQ